ncbi:hypothetical protein DPEC_G00325310 [Dallia pectoralis]|uniref:Uncharacterized protein n=1 Tax=Dallia pectoralis TaxID=75939 RepID=A0ACC2F7I3_DALPE|nr:hypothetical protein DPEC_G00325310 [Dallia pectoralis]
MSKGDMITRTPTLNEHFETWLREQIQHWRQMTNDSVTLDPKAMQTQLFRGAVVDILPGDVQSKLADVPGLDTMLHDQWAETLKHFFKAHQETEKAMDKQGTEVTRKLAQASLDQIKKLKGMGVVKSGPEDSDEIRSHGPVRKGSETPSSAPTTVQLIESPRQTEYVRNTPRKRGKRGARFKGKYEGMTCWGCNLEGHVRRNCPTSPWPCTEGQC